MNYNQITKYATVGENTEITIKPLSGDQCNMDLRIFFWDLVRIFSPELR